MVRSAALAVLLLCGCAIAPLSEPTDVADGCIKWLEGSKVFEMHGAMTVRFSRGFLEIVTHDVDVVRGRDTARRQSYSDSQFFLVPARSVIAVAPGPECRHHPEHES